MHVFRQTKFFHCLKGEFAFPYLGYMGHHVTQVPVPAVPGKRFIPWDDDDDDDDDDDF